MTKELNTATTNPSTSEPASAKHNNPHTTPPMHISYNAWNAQVVSKETKHATN
eukprot:CAMPEP_0196132774 /NCGR_PEP_ID=MMETSP0910-20130528/2259_1 /TAXON_ID=49265 /ORGANISM="Thalassiosira rotula, Strain GSO102" /LENGTH=52 /DNA_ID=CAMNT_0041392413 /DNA_START=309 /DNA_END=467 /DNA_ORIENTATION=+